MPVHLRDKEFVVENPKLKVFGDDFLRRIGMANAGAVRKALQRLMDHSLVYKVDD